MTGNRHSAASAVHGISWVLANSLVSRVLVFLSQLILGYLLVPRDFGLYALALSLTSTLSVVRNGGTSQLLVQRGTQSVQQVSPIAQYALIANCVALVALLIVAPIANAHLRTAGIGTLAAFIALSFPIGTFASVYRSQLAVCARFREAAILNTLSTVLWQIEVIVLALLGCGAYSYAVPIVIQSAVDGVLGWYFVRTFPVRRPWLSWVECNSLFRETRWIMAGAGMLSLGLTGQYLAAGLFADATTIGVYFFGYQLVFAIFVIINNAIESVLPSTFTQLNDQPARQSRVTVSVLSTLIFVTMAIASLVFMCGKDAIHFLWSGRWDLSGEVVCITAWSIPAWIVIAVVRALLDARGMWRTRFLLLGIYGVGTFVVVAIAARTGKALTIAYSLTGFYVVFGAVLLLLLPSVISVCRREIAAIIALPAFVFIACLLGAHSILWLLPAGLSGRLMELVGAGAFAVLAVSANMLLFRRKWAAALGVFNNPAPSPWE